VLGCANPGCTGEKGAVGKGVKRQCAGCRAEYRIAGEVLNGVQGVFVCLLVRDGRGLCQASVARCQTRSRRVLLHTCTLCTRKLQAVQLTVVICFKHHRLQIMLSSVVLTTQCTPLCCSVECSKQDWGRLRLFCKALQSLAAFE